LSLAEWADHDATTTQTISEQFIQAAILRKAVNVRKRGKIDGNQAEIVASLRRIGATVKSLAAEGDGCPDLLVGWRGKNFLLEVKDGNQPPSKQRLTEDEVEWQRGWKGSVETIYSLDQALKVIGA
jgi:hypothetical protein